MDVCTIIAKNYVAYARTLARSFREQHPEGRFYVLIIDDFEGWIRPEEEPFIVVRPDDIGVEHFGRMAALYDVLELSTAVKPWLLRWLLARSPDGIAVYLDPDMRLYAPLEEMFATVHEHKLVLSPHNVDAMPRDGKRPNEQDILIAGTYNLGFIGIGSGDFADELLDWWAERLETDCIVDPARGFFVDQRWVDLVPGMADSFCLLRDRGFNVAYWNLHARPIRTAEGRWMAGSVPLRLMHYSGFDPRRPHLLSKHQDRIRLSDEPDLARLCADYAAELDANGAVAGSAWPYTYVETSTGLPLTGLVRKVLGKLAAEGHDAGSAFDPEGSKRLVDLLNEPAGVELGGSVGVTRYLATLHGIYPDLQRLYPDLSGADAERLVHWAAELATVEVPEQLRPEPKAPRRASTSSHDSAPPAPVPAPAAAEFGVNVVGYLNSELGVGEIARQAITALDAAAVPLIPVGIPTTVARQGHEFMHRGAGAAVFPLNLVCVNADQVPAFAAAAGPRFFTGRYSIGWWWWEVAEFPSQWMSSFEQLDEVWAGSAFVASALSAVSPVPVVRMPVPLTVRRSPRKPRDRFGFTDEFVFLFTFDYNSVAARKNPLGCLEAFLRAFPEPGEAVLVLKSINADRHPSEHERLRLAAAGHSHVRLLDDYLSAQDKDRLTASCDCYVSLHRSEGFGITMAEAMYLGKPVIATGYSGNLDFMTPDNSWLVDYELVPIGPGSEPYPAHAQWAEPDLEHAAALMREVFEQPESARERAAVGASDVRRRHDPAVVGAQMAARLRAAARGLNGAVVTSVEAPAALSRALHAGNLLESGPVRRGRNARGVAQKIALRGMEPHTSHQRRLDGDVIAAVQALARDVRALDARQLGAETDILRGLRSLERRIEERAQAADARIDDLAGRIDDLARRAELLEGLPEPSTAGADDAPYPSAPEEPWSIEYNEAHARFVARALVDPEILQAVGRGRPLPTGYGLGFDERAVELPWVAARDLSGLVLDAGSSLNHAHILRRLRRRMDDLHIVTLAPEERAFPQLNVSYLYADLRRLPIADGVYDRVVSISTLEHVGLDLTHFGAGDGHAPDPQREALRAAAELRRVLRPGGELLLTVPVGRPDRFDWVRALSLDELDELVASFEPEELEVTYFLHNGGWSMVTREEVADARYRDHFTSGPPRGRVVAAEAVACVALRLGPGGSGSVDRD